MENSNNGDASFGEAIAWASDGPGAFVGSVPARWMQGRTSFGGITAGVAMRALRLVEGEGRCPRSVHTSFFAPLRAEPARVTAEVVRRGRFLTHARAEIRQGDTLTSQVVATFADDRPSEIEVAPPVAPARPMPDALVDLPFIPGVSPEFTRAFAFRWTDGGMPFSGAKEPKLGGWCRHRTNPGPDPYAAALGLVDSWPSPFVSLFTRPGPASSVTWTTNFIGVPPSVDPEAWWWFGSEAVAADHGYGTMRGALYTPAGALCATVEQLVAVFDSPAP